MKKIWILILFITSGIVTEAQSFSDMVKTMLEQIAELQGYLMTAEKGYKIVEDGLSTIRTIKNGEFNLHMVFFSSLKSINPTITKMAEVADILALQYTIVQKAAANLKSYQQNKWLYAHEISYIGNVYSKLIKETGDNLSALIDLTTNGSLTMTDGDRIKRIQRIDSDMQTKYGFMQAFSDQAGMLAAKRQQEFETINSVRNLYGY